MMNDSLSADPPATKFRLEPWPTAIVLFFVVVVAVNLLLVRFSQTSWSGLVTEGAYSKGLAFNKTLAAQEAQEALGWQVALDTTPLRVGAAGHLRLSLRDRQGAPLPGAQIQGMLFRPVHQGVDQPFAMQEEQPGLYSTPLSVPMPGHWEVRLEMTAPSGRYRYVQRIHLPATAPESTHER
ncbi:MAG: FixH family protein [Magnetococcus sp. YQC-3]